MTDGRFYRRNARGKHLVQIVDPDPGTCDGLSVLFQLDGYEVRASENVKGFLSSYDLDGGDIVILNLQISGDSGIEVLRRFKQSSRQIPVIMMSDTADVEAAVLAVKAGASHVVVKPISADVLLRRVHEVLHRSNVLITTAGRPGMEAISGFHQLTPREREVLQLITDGQSNKEAGRYLGISPRTIEVHRARVMEKLGARNTADLMRIVLCG